MDDRGGPDRMADELSASTQPLLPPGDGSRLLYIYDLSDQRNLYVNTAVTSLLGYSSEAFDQLRENLLDHLVHPDDTQRAYVWAEAVRQLADGAVRREEIRVRHADGSWRILSVNEAVFSRDSDGAVSRVLGMAEDVTEVRKAEERQRMLTGATVALAAAVSMEDVARLAADSARSIFGVPEAIIVYHTSGDGRATRVVLSPHQGNADAEGFTSILDDNHTFARILAGRRLSMWDPAEFRRRVGEGYLPDALPPKLAEGIWGALPLVGREGDSVGVLLVTPPGDRAFTDDEETVLTQFGQITALTLENRRLFASLQQLNENLTRSEERFRMASEAVKGHVYDWDRKTDQVRRSAGLARLLGLQSEPETSTAFWWQERIHPDDLRRLYAEMSQEGFDWVTEYRVRHEDGSYIWVLEQAKPVYDDQGEVIRVVGYTMDITARKRAETRSRRVFDSNVVGVVYWNIDTSLITDANDRFLEMSGYTREDIQTGLLNFRAMTPPEWENRNESGIREIRTVGAGVPYEKEYFRKDGSRLPIIIGGALFDDSLSEGFSLILDISEQKRTETALRESEERFRSLIETLPQFVWIVGGDRQLEYVSPQWVEYTGLSLEQTRSGQYDGAIHPDDIHRIFAAFAEAHQAGVPYTAETRIRKRGGGYRWFQVRGRPVLDAEGKVLRWIGVTTDIDDQKLAQERIANLNERLKRSMAESHHRIKNNLQVLSALSEMQTIGAGETVPVSMMTRLGQQIRTLAALHDLLTMEYRTRADDDESIALRAALTKLMGMMESVSGGRTILWECDDIRLPVKRTETFVLLLNELVQNAIKHGNGTIDVCVRSNGEIVSLAVADDGKGFPPDFDPYKSANTGMELIEAMGRWDLQGEIRYENRPSGGACVTVTFPLPPHEPMVSEGNSSSVADKVGPL